MDSRFPAWIRWLVRKLSFLAIPGLGKFVVAAAVIAFVAKNIVGVPMDRFIFDPQRVLDGEYWRLIIFPSQGIGDPLWLLFFVLYIYFVFNSIEATWGPAPLTIYTLASYTMGIAGSFFLGAPIPIWLYIVENVSLAFGTLFPNMELYIYFILPVKAKWLALIAGLFLFLQFFTTDFEGKIMYLMVFSPYLLFFAPMLYGTAQTRLRSRRPRINKDDWR